MKKILLITSGYLPLPPIKGGAVEVLTQNYLEKNEQLKKAKFVVYSYGESIQPTKKYANTEYRFIKINKLLDLVFKVAQKSTKNRSPDYFLYRIKKDINKRNEQFDIALVENKPKSVIYTKRKICNNVVLHAHNDWFGNQSKEICESCTKVITVSNYLGIAIRRRTSAGKIVTVFNAVDERQFKKKNSAIVSKIKDDLGIKKKDLVFLYTGKIKPEKGTLELIQAFNKINSEHAKLILVGSSFSMDTNDNDYVKKAKSIASTNKNILFTGFVEYNDVSRYYSIADVQIVPSQSEDSCPLTAIEGIDAGLAQIVSDSGGIPEIVKGTKAIVVKRGPGFVEELQKAICSLINDKDKIDTMKKSSLAQSKRFKSDDFCKKMLKEITE